MKKLLSIVRGRMQENVMDITMKFTLSALWNLTDESPRTCKVSDLVVDPVKKGNAPLGVLGRRRHGVVLGCPQYIPWRTSYRDQNTRTPQQHCRGKISNINIRLKFSNDLID